MGPRLVGNSSELGEWGRPVDPAAEIEWPGWRLGASDFQADTVMYEDADIWRSGVVALGGGVAGVRRAEVVLDRMR